MSDPSCRTLIVAENLGMHSSWCQQALNSKMPCTCKLTGESLKLEQAKQEQRERDAATAQYMREDRLRDAVDHPSHYGGEGNPYEAIKVIEAWGLNFNLGNAVKYISRAGKKDPSKIIEDLEKARWYLEREITNQKGRAS